MSDQATTKRIFAIRNRDTGEYLFGGSIDSTALLLAFEAGRRACAWIACSERLPPIGEVVIVGHPGGSGLGVLTTHGWKLSGHAEDSFLGDLYGFDSVDWVTHWQPMPAGPEVKA